MPTQPAATQGTGRSSTKKLAKGKTFLYKKIKYKVSSLKGKSGTVSLITTSKKNLKQAVIPATLQIQGHKLKVTSIEKNAFRSCIKLKKIFIQTKQLTKLGKNAFQGISKKVSVKVPKGMSKKQRTMLKSLRFS